MPQLTNIETFAVEAIKDEQLPSEVPGFEDLPKIVRTVLDNCPMVINAADRDQYLLPFGDSYDSRLTDDDHYTLEQPSPEHLRSFALRGPGLPHLWHDEFGNEYRALTLKGNNFSHSQLIQSATAEGRYIAYGLQESAVIERVLRVSRLLREAGVATEYIVGLAEPTGFQLRDNGVALRHEPVDVIEYKQVLADKLWAELPKERQTLEEYTEIFTKLQRSTYYVSMRATDTEYRFHDVTRYQHQRQQLYQQVNASYGTHYDVENDNDWPLYIKEQYLPRLATNLGRLHALGLAHRFPNSMNISALGAIVDLDSVHGEPLGFGDDPITPADIARDIFTAVEERLGSPLDFSQLTLPEMLPDFLPLYFDAYAQALGETPEATETHRLAVLAALAQYADSRVDERFGRIGRDARNVAIAEIDKIALHVETGAVTEQWLAQNADELRQQLDSYIADNLHDIASAMLMTIILEGSNELTKDEPDMYDLCFGERKSEVNFDNIAYETLFSHAIRDVIGASYEQFVKANSAELFTAKSSELPPELAEYMAEQVAKVFDDGVLVDAWVADTLDELTLQYKDQLNHLAQPSPANYVLTESDNQDDWPLNVTSGNTVVMQTHGVPLQAVLDYAKEHGIPLSMNKPIYKPENRDAQKLWGDSFTVPDGHKLLQVITDVELDGSLLDYTDKSDERRATSISVDSDQQRFAAYVTEDTEGQRHIAIDIRDILLLRALRSASQTAILTALATDSAGMPQLFDTQPYFVRKFEDYAPRFLDSIR